MKFPSELSLPEHSIILTGLMVLAWLEPDRDTRELYFSAARGRFDIDDETFNRYRDWGKKALDDFKTTAARENVRGELTVFLHENLPMPQMVSTEPVPEVNW